MSIIWHRFRHHVQIAMWVRHAKTLRRIKTKWVVETADTFYDKAGRKEHKYNVDLEMAILDKSNNPILNYEVGKTDPIDFNNRGGSGKSSRLYDITFKSKAAEDALNEGANKSMFLIIGLFVIAIIGVMLYSQYQLGVANDKVAQLTVQMGKIIANITKGGGVIVK